MSCRPVRHAHASAHCNRSCRTKAIRTRNVLDRRHHSTRVCPPRTLTKISQKISTSRRNTAQERASAYGATYRNGCRCGALKLNHHPKSPPRASQTAPTIPPVTHVSRSAQRERCERQEWLRAPNLPRQCAGQPAHGFCDAMGDASWPPALQP
jgi:hypothetical protein